MKRRGQRADRFAHELNLLRNLAAFELRLARGVAGCLTDDGKGFAAALGERFVVLQPEIRPSSISAARAPPMSFT
jgi:hypothetical protein